MKEFFKKRIGLIILIIAILAFPSSLSTQARLNMRAIVTGLAIDKVDGKYEVTAQIVKTSPSTESSGEKATVNFVSDTAETIIGAIAKLSYKTGKTAGFSHTNFLILGKDVLEDDLVKTLDYFMRDNTITDSMLLLIAEDKASDEIKKTKDVELSIAVGLQKVFMYREKEGDGVMVSLLEFLKDSISPSKTSVASVLNLKSNEENSKDNPLGGSSGGDNSSSSGSTGSGSSGSSSSGGESGTEDGGEQGGGEKYQYFEAQTSLGVFVDGKKTGELKEDEILGFMLANKKTIIDDVQIENIEDESLKQSKIGIKIKNKKVSKKVRFEGDIPCLDIVVKIKNAAIYEIENDMLIDLPNNKQFDAIKKAVKEKIVETITKCFKKSKELNADIWGAYELGVKHHYNKTSKNFKTMEEFLKQLKLNVSVEIDRLEY